MEQAIKRKPNVHAFLYIYRNHAAQFWWCAVPYVDSQGRRRQRRRSFRDSRLGGKNAALTAARGNQIRAADLLGLNRNTLRKKIRELGVSVYRSSRSS